MQTPSPCDTAATPQFADVLPTLLAREEGTVLTVDAATVLGGGWPAFLRRLLPPVPVESAHPARLASALRAPDGMADFLLGQGKGAARDVAGALAGQGAFWASVHAEVAALSAGGTHNNTIS